MKQTRHKTEELQHESPVPLYAQLSDIIIDQIKSKMLQPGERIPTERELSETYHVSRITVRRTLSDLVELGYLYKQQGKGTFVHQPKIEDNVLENKSFSSLVLSNGMKPSTKVLAVALQYPSPVDMHLLEVDDKSKILFIHRVRYMNDRPVMLEKNYLAPKYTSLIHEDLDRCSLYELLTSKFQITALRPEKSIEISYATEYEATCLQCKKNDPVILVRELIRDQDGVPVHHTKQIVTGNHFSYKII